MDTTHECPVAVCALRCEHDKLMCLKHWRMVPRALQDKVYSTWRRVHRDRSAYLEARDEAVQFVDARCSASHNQGKLL